MEEEQKNTDPKKDKRFTIIFICVVFAIPNLIYIVSSEGAMERLGQFFLGVAGLAAIGFFWYKFKPSSGCIGILISIAILAGVNYLISSQAISTGVGVIAALALTAILAIVFYVNMQSNDKDDKK